MQRYWHDSLFLSQFRIFKATAKQTTPLEGVIVPYAESEYPETTLNLGETFAPSFSIHERADIFSILDAPDSAPPKD